MCAVVALPSCGNNGCEEDRETFLSVQLRTSGHLNLISVKAWGIGHQSDSLMMQVSRPTDLEFILQPDKDFCELRLETIVDDNGDQFQYTDTLRVSYKPQPYFLDMECGCSMFFTLNDASVTNHLFREVTMRDKEITNHAKTNLVLQY